MYINTFIDLDDARNKHHKLIIELTETSKEMIGGWGSLNILLSGEIFSPNSLILMDDGRVTPSLTKENPNAEVSFLLGQNIRLPVDILVTFTVMLMPNDRLLEIKEVVFTIDPQ